MTTKVCTKCGVEKELSEFHKQAPSKDGRRSRCAVCSREWNNKWGRENAGRVKETCAAWRKANPEKAKASYTAWRKANPEEAREPYDAWRKANPEKANEASRKGYIKARDTLSASYIKMCLGLSAPPQELIDLKRDQLLTYRATKELQQTIKEIQNGTK